MALLEIENLKKQFYNGTQPLEILKDINMTLEAGTSGAVVGPSGCGKSTLLNIIGGLDKPTGGIVRVASQDITKLSEKALSPFRSKRIGFIFQFHFLLKDFTALENIMIPALMTGMKKKNARLLALELINDINLENRKSHYPGELSGGERQRIAVARALINNPDLILADEPTGSLDEDNSLIVQDMLFNLVGKYKKSLLLVTHDKLFSQKCSVIFQLTHGIVSCP
jgi:lipoprotein-releasing system ATP-binding protein